LSNKEVAQWIRKNLDYDQLILEYYDDKDPSSGWIHCSYVNNNRQQCLVYNGGQYQSWT
jgi:zinc D-Ala-D-Ala carboxypeptidase